MNFQRNRVYLEAYDEIFVPFLFYFLMSEKNGKKSLWFLFIFIGITIFSFISNIRIRFLMLIVSLIASVIFLGRYLKKFLWLLFLVLLMFYFSYLALIKSKGYTVLERVLLENKYEDVLTVSTRLERWVKAVEMGLSSPLLGVGLGNYYDNLESSMKRPTYPSLLIQKEKEAELGTLHPHNIFFNALAETGGLGLASLLLLFLYFLVRDIKIFFKKYKEDLFVRSFIMSFWTLFLAAFFNPSTTVNFYVVFWFLRVAIERLI
jgi:O-antigen ligase